MYCAHLVCVCFLVLLLMCWSGSLLVGLAFWWDSLLAFDGCSWSVLVLGVCDLRLGVAVIVLLLYDVMFALMVVCCLIGFCYDGFVILLLLVIVGFVVVVGYVVVCVVARGCLLGVFCVVLDSVIWVYLFDLIMLCLFGFSIVESCFWIWLVSSCLCCMFGCCWQLFVFGFVFAWVAWLVVVCLICFWRIWSLCCWRV